MGLKTINNKILDFVLLILPSQSASLVSYYLTDVLNTYDGPGLSRQPGMNRQLALKERRVSWEMIGQQ